MKCNIGIQRLLGQSLTNFCYIPEVGSSCLPPVPECETVLGSPLSPVELAPVVVEPVVEPMPWPDDPAPASPLSVPYEPAPLVVEPVVAPMPWPEPDEPVSPLEVAPLVVEPVVAPSPEPVPEEPVRPLDP